MFVRLNSLIGATVLLCATAGNAWAADVLGAGATLPGPLYAKWAERYHQLTQIKVNYQPIGSGGGVKQITAGTVDFGATDDPVKPDVLQSEGLLQFPSVLAALTVVANVRGVDARAMKLDGALVAAIYLGEITRWNDPKIAALNPTLSLPAQTINVVRRADGSGSTALFTEYLAAASPAWRDSVGVAKSVSWPVGIGGKGNEGVATYVKRIPGSIGYVELLTAIKANLQPVQLRNPAGAFARATPTSVEAAAASAVFDPARGLAASLINQPGADAWPLTATTYVLFRRSDLGKPTTADALKFFRWAITEGGTDATALNYVPLPASVRAQVLGLIDGAKR
jgi:phosphate transport system substrate-binding protein